jgi:hypothetical protein
MSRKGGVNLPPGFDPKDRKYTKFANALPTRETCDLTDPAEMFLWMLVALPGVNGGHQVMPSSYNMLVSEHLYRCGAMLQCPQCGHTKEPQCQYVSPSADDAHWMTSPGTWKDPKDVIQQEDPMDVVLDKMPPQIQARLLRRLQERIKGEH